MINLKDFIGLLILGFITLLFIDKYVAKKIISIFGGIKFFNHFGSGPIIMIMIIFLLSMLFVHISAESAYKYKYFILVLILFLAGIPLQIYFIQGKY